MRARRIVLNVIAVAAAVLLSGCYVASQKLPASTGPVLDEKLVGAWQALNEDGKPDFGTYLHFLKTDEGKPLTLMFVEEHAWTEYEITSLMVGKRQMFAAKPTRVMREAPLGNYALGFYEVKGDTFEFRLLDPKKIKAAIDAHQLKGFVEPDDKGGRTILTGSPQELAAFLGSTDLDKLTGGKPSRAQRIK